MRIPDNCVCRTCKKIFCCSNCREQHEVKNHAIVVRFTEAETKNLAHLFCPICEKKPLVLRKDMYDEILEHVETHHLPLHCRKCEKVYHQIGDLRDFSLCNPANGGHVGQECYVTDQSCETDATKSTVTKSNSQTSISTQTSPMRHFNDSHATPISLLNLRWKARNKVTQEEFISDSVSSIRNISSISNSSLRRSIGVTTTNKGKLVRSTSTPVQAECCIKPKEQTFNASSGQVSSIYNSAFESDISPAPQNPTNASAKQSFDVNRYRKVAVRPKMSAVTPLRHVMSKSIQKAFAEHGAPTEHAGGVIIGSPLDLRLSPVIRRTEINSSSNSEIPSSNKQTPALRKELLFSTQKMTTESIVITRTEHLSNMESISNGSNTNSNSVKMNYLSDIANSLSAASNIRNSVYKTCHSVEIITATEVSAVSVNQQGQTNGQATGSEMLQLPPITPITRIPGAAINKKIIQFDTPKPGQDQTDLTHTELSVDADEKFYTPEATPVRKSSARSSSLDGDESDFKKIRPRNLSNNFEPMRRPTLQTCNSSSSFTRIENVNDPYEDEVFLSNKETTELKNTQERPAERTWSLGSIMNSMIRFPSLRGTHDKDRQETKSESNTSSIIKRCASIAGSLIQRTKITDETPANSLKRKRTNTVDTSHFRDARSSYAGYGSSSPNDDNEFNITSKRFRIQGRRPIERMRHNS